MLMETFSGNWIRARTTNSTASSYAAKIPTLTEPTGAGVWTTDKGGGRIQNVVTVKPYAIASDNDTFKMRVIGWNKCDEGTPAAVMWFPTVLVDLALTASAEVGVAGGVVLGTERFADTMTLTTGNDDVSVDIVSPTGDVSAHAVIDLKGSQKIEFSFAIVSGATSMNALFKFH